MKTIFIITIAAFGFVSAMAQPAKINFTAPKAYPEGIAYDAKGDRFFVSSVTTGTIGMVDKNGKYSPFYADKSLKSSFGMKVDPRKNLLWVCVGDPTYSEFRDSSTYKRMARLIAVDLSNGHKTKDINLAALAEGKHFPNDLTIDNKGDIYITDSYSPVVYKVSASGEAKVFAESDLFKSVQVGLNGIVCHPSGFLIVAHNTKGALYKIDIEDPTKITKIKTPDFFPGADGMMLDGNDLYVVQGKGVSKVFRLTSDDQWQSARVESSTLLTDRFQNPTTIAMKNDKVYVLNAKLNELADSTMNFSREFSIQEAVFVQKNK